jgi:hypothetical protein
MSETQAPQRYSAGERVWIGIELHDASGLYGVTGLFVQKDNPNTEITLQGYGEGAQRATVYIQNVVTTNTPPGQYHCKYIQAQDGRGNYSTLYPDITFYVDQQSILVDDRGPELKGWNFLPKDRQLQTESPLELTAGDTTTEKMGAQLDTQEYTQGDVQEDAPSAPVAPGDIQGGGEQEGDALQLIEGKMNEMAQDITEDTGGHGDVYQHTEQRMDEMAKEMTEDTGAHGDIHLHAQRRMDEMAKEMFED